MEIYYCGFEFNFISCSYNFIVFSPITFEICLSKFLEKERERLAICGQLVGELCILTTLFSLMCINRESNNEWVSVICECFNSNNQLVKYEFRSFNTRKHFCCCICQLL